ncbi:MAG: pyrroline-5-carboxylate reductase [Clostridia bacterium]|nr:pyrroline-5-carboxylate reductase [Clostridia bacterium]
MKCGFIGCGNMGGALAAAVRKGNAEIELFLADNDTEKRDLQCKTLHATAVMVEQITKDCDVFFIGVKPQGIKGLLEQIAPLLKNRNVAPIIITMAAGVTTNTITDLIGAVLPVVRIMPNTPVLLGCGMIEVCKNDAVSDEQLALALDLLKEAGRLDVIPEDLIDAASALSGSGPAFAYYFAEQLMAGAKQCGIPEDKLVEYTAQTLLGAAKMMLKGDKTPEELRIAVCSPGGSTLAGLTAMQTEAFDTAVQDTVKRAFARSKELGKV